jgi:hypothetical protein
MSSSGTETPGLTPLYQQSSVCAVLVADAVYKLHAGFLIPELIPLREHSA